MFPSRVFWAALAWGLTSLAQAAPLTFTVALDLAEQRAPTLAAQVSRVEASRAAALPANELPDPKAFVGIDNFPISGPDSGSLTADFMTMQKVGVMQDIPNAAKRRARQQAAQALSERDNAQLKLERLQVRRETAGAWIARYYVEKRFTLLNELERENRLFEDTLKAQIAAGKAMPADAVTPRQELLEIEDRRDELRQKQANAIARLRRWIGEAAEAPLAGDAPAITIDPERFKQHLRIHPELAVFEPMRRMAEAEVQEAKAANHPDWGVEFAYARRGETYGDMVSLQLSADLPLFTAQRQAPLISAKRHELARVDAKRQAMARMHWSELESQLAKHTMLERKLNRLRSQGIPLSQEKMALQLAAYRASTGNLNAVLESRREWINQRLKAIELEGKRNAVAAQLHIFYGEE